MLLYYEKLFKTKQIESIDSLWGFGVLGPRQFVLIFSGQHTPRASQHQRNPSNNDATHTILRLTRHDLLPTRVLHIHRNRRRVRHVSQSTLLRRYFLHHVIFLHARSSNVYIRVLQVKVWITIARHSLVRLGVNDFFDLLVHQVVERVDVLPDQPSHLEKRRQELVFILQRRDRSGDLRGVAREAVHGARIARIRRSRARFARLFRAAAGIRHAGGDVVDRRVARAL